MKNVSNIFVKLAVALFVVIALVVIMQQMMKYNELQEKKQEQQLKNEQTKEKIEELEEQLAAPFDDEYIIKIAKEKLDLSLPQSIIFYNDLNE